MSTEQMTAVRQVPICEEGLLGIHPNRLITDIKAPELMAVDSRESVTYACYSALRLSPNKSEAGYYQVQPLGDTETAHTVNAYRAIIKRMFS